jgi:putative ABC transport system substrate-binding protein
MRRRAFIALLATPVAWTSPAHGQRQGMPVVGFLNTATPELYQFNVAAFRAGLAELGYVEGRNVAIEYRWARGDYDRMPALASELIGRGVAAIAATGDVASARAAQAATTKIPVVFTIGGDPVRFGLVASYGRPGSNVTGISLPSSAIAGKRIELLHALAPNAKIALLMNPDNPNAAAEERDSRDAARGLGHQVLILNVRNAGDFQNAFDAFVRERAQALFVATDPMLLSQREPLAEFAARQRVPAICFAREFVVSGGLVSYGASIREMYRLAGVYVGRILNGANPADLPVLQPSIVELVINLRTAKALGIEVPKTLLLRANEVIE